MKLTAQEQKLIDSVLRKSAKLGVKQPVASLSALRALLARDERMFVKKFLALTPRQLGFRGKFIGVFEPPRTLVQLRGQRLMRGRTEWRIGKRYVPHAAHQAFTAMNRALKKDAGGLLAITSGYRSPAAQVLTFLRFLQIYQYDFARTAQRVALPGYSEHGDPEHPALDIQDVHGPALVKEGPLRFSKTKEYRWLLKNAKRFGFRLSYPRNNRLGMMFEPWHWRFVGTSTKQP